MLFKKKNEAALMPPMGWNSWDCFAANVTEEELLANARAMKEKLAPYGFQYVVCDIQWSEPLAGSENVVYRDFADLNIDEYGRQLPAENRFPSSKGGVGFKKISDEIHAMGLKFGIHIMRGIPRKAVEKNTKVLGTKVTARAVADPFSICPWNGDMYGVKNTPEGQAYYDSIFELYASWGVDFVKVDDIAHEHLYPDHAYGENEVHMIRKAIDKSGRSMVLSLSPGPAVIEKAWPMERDANMWRITDDFWDDWKLLKAMFERCEVWQRHVGEGSWPDCDMLPLGRIGTGFRAGRDTNFTKDEQRTLMNLWGIFRSPLIMGGDLRELDDWTLSLLTNKEVLEANQHGADPTQLERDDSHVVWTSEGNDCRFLAIFNISEEEKEFHFNLNDLEMEVHNVCDIWNNSDAVTAGNELTVKLAPHASAMYKVR